MENKNNTEEKETKQDTINQISKSNQGKRLIKARNKMQILYFLQPINSSRTKRIGKFKARAKQNNRKRKEQNWNI